MALNIFIFSCADRRPGPGRPSLLGPLESVESGASTRLAPPVSAASASTPTSDGVSVDALPPPLSELELIDASFTCM